MWEYATRFVIQVVKSQHTAFNEQVWTLTDFEPTSSTAVTNDWSWCRTGSEGRIREGGIIYIKKILKWFHNSYIK